MSTTEQQLQNVDVKLEETKKQAAASITSWATFLALPWETQENLRRLVPERVAELERAHFAKVKV